MRKLRFESATPDVTVAEHLTYIAYMYELEGDKRRANTFRNASTTVAGRNGLTEDDALDLPGIGRSIATVIGEFAEEGTSGRYRDLAANWPIDAIRELTQVKGIGPKKAMDFIERGITTLGDLVAEVDADRVTGDLANEVRRAAKSRQKRVPREQMEPIVKLVVKTLKAAGAKVEVCGSYRRGRETLKDLDVVACAAKKKHAALHRALAGLGATAKHGEVRSAVVVDGVQVDLWTVEPESFGAAKAHATGSKAHNVWRRTALRKIGIRENEYGLWEGETRVGGKDERDAYRLLGVPYVKPEDREEAPK